jgi:DNA-binding NarL/FixJ family response regulator
VDPLTNDRSPVHRSRRKALLFCQHPVAQERFLRLLTRAGFEVVVHSQLRLPTPATGKNGHSVSLAVVDCSDPDSCLEFVGNLRHKQAQLPVLALLPKLHPSPTFALLRLGVKGVLSYGQAQRELPRAADELAGGGHWIPREILTGFIESILPELHGSEALNPGIKISRRERDVLDLLLENLSNKEIAAKLFVSERTVKFHVSNLLSKFGVQRRAELIILWMRRATAAPWESQGRAQTISTHIN